jgi:hypothetical protein
MSYLAQRAVLDTRTRVRLWTGSLSALATATALLALAGLLALRWWQQTTAVPLSWQLPPAEALFLLPGVPVLGLVALRAVVGGRMRTVAGHHLMSWAGRWAWVWVATTAAGLLHTVRGLYGVPLVELLAADNLLTVAAGSEAVRSSVIVLWVALLIALFATRLGGWRESLAVLVLSGTALVAGLPVDPLLAHGHAETAHPVVAVVGAVQVLALACWLGALVAVGHLRTPPYLFRHHLLRFGVLVSAVALVAGAAGVLAGLLAPQTPASWVVGAAQLAGVALVAVVGYRHRRRAVEVVAQGRAVLLLALVAGEAVVLVALLALGMLVPAGL